MGSNPQGFARLVGRVQFTLQHWTPLLSSMAEEVLEASSLGSQLRFAVLAKRESISYSGSEIVGSNPIGPMKTFGETSGAPSPMLQRVL